MSYKDEFEIIEAAEATEEIRIFSEPEIFKHGWGIIHRPNCQCHDRQFIVGAVFFGNGAEHYKLCCWTCGRPGRAWLSKKSLTDQEMKTAPIIENNVEQIACERCERYVGVEYHHWAPQSIFRDSDDWPGAWLCCDCHKEWHRKMGR